MICSVCEVNDASYKCPKCKAPFCCINCSKIHKTICPGDQPNPNETKKEGPMNETTSISPFETFRSHPKIINALGDPRLQQIISRIDTSNDRETELVEELEINPEFKKFVDSLLEVMPSSITT